MTKILLIEDEFPIRTNLEEVLTEEGFQVISAADGKEGIALAQSHLPDLIICDIMMPEMDGYQVLSYLQSQPATVNIPLIFLTAKAERQDQRAAMELGADDYITKPCSSHELFGAVTSRLKKQKQYLEQYEEQKTQARKLKQTIDDLQAMTDSEGELLERLSQELRDPLSNINMALALLKTTASQKNLSEGEILAKQEQYLKILRQECGREIDILNRISNLKDLLNSDKLDLLSKVNKPSLNQDTV